MIIDKQQYWNTVIEHYYDVVHFEGKHTNIYDWLEDEHGAVSATGKPTIKFNDDKKATWFLMKYSR